jgi:hypothetical protein
MATIRPEVTGRGSRRSAPREKPQAEETEEEIEEDDADPVDDVSEKSPRQRRPRPQQPPPDDASKTINQFCAAEQMSRPHYFNMRRRGLGPREIRDGRFIRITPEAHAEWRRARERSQVGSDKTVANRERAPP